PRVNLRDECDRTNPIPQLSLKHSVAPARCRANRNSSAAHALPGKLQQLVDQRREHTFERNTLPAEECRRAARAEAAALMRRHSGGKTNLGGTGSISQLHQDFDSMPQ